MEKAKQAVILTVSLLEVCPVPRSTIDLALSLSLSDFEDALQLACAVEIDAQGIVTRDKTDFRDSTLPALSTKEALAYLGGEGGF